jgi:hypothetical protein
MSEPKTFSLRKKCYVIAMHEKYFHTSPDYVLISVMVLNLTYTSTC